MTLSKLTEDLHEATGATGAELEAMVHFTSAIYADAMGRRDIGDYFAQRCKDAMART